MFCLFLLQSFAQEACDLCGWWGSIANRGSRYVRTIKCASLLEHEVFGTNHTGIGQSSSARSMDCRL